MIIYIALLLILLPFSAIALYRTWRIARSIDRLSLLSDDVVGGCEAIGFTGFSVVCYSETSVEQISMLLGQEYKRYEVIVVMDGTRHHEKLQSIIARYKLIRVNCNPTLELSAQICHLYRSRQRGYRRLIVVDTPHRSVCEDINAGVMVASFDHILPLRADETLYPKIIEHLAILLCDETVQRAPYIISRSDGAVLLRREAIVQSGGLAPSALQHLGEGHKIYTPIKCGHPRKRDFFSARHAIIFIVGALLIVRSVIENALNLIPIILIIGALFIIALCRARLLSRRGCSLWEVLYHFRKMATIFPTRKFNF